MTLDIYIQMFNNGEQIGRIILLKKISSSLLKEKYGDWPKLQDFYNLLSEQDLIIN